MSLNDFITDTQEAARLLEVAPPSDFKAVEERYPILVNRYYLSLIESENDPIWKQCMPDKLELADDLSSFDPLAEEEQTAAPRLIHRFHDRVVLLATGKCAMRCRFCFRKRTWKTGSSLSDISQQELEAACEYLRANPQVKEVLISGGDPLMITSDKLDFLLRTLSEVPSIEVMRIGSRLPVTMPERITQEYVDILGAHTNLWLMTHFNHPREVTSQATECCQRFIKAGIPVLNQTVLLAGVNDNADTLETLFRKLIAIRVKPHYLFHVDPVRGVRHFATGIEKGLEILRQFRPRLSSLAVPTFAIDLPEGGGKVALQPEYRIDGKFPDIHGAKLIEYPERL
jgi:lysine 2,3-aminomutase